MRQRLNRRTRQEASDSKDRWMITYADLITLLLIFFIIMYAMSRLDVEKYAIVNESLQLTFKSGDSLLEKGSGITGSADKYPSKNPAPTAPGTDNSNANQDGNSGSTKPLTDREQAFREQEEQLQSLMKVIQEYIKSNNLEDQIFVADLAKGITITLSDRFLFDVGKAELKAGSSEALDKLASLFRKLDTVIGIEGHTDNQPVGRGSRYKDNWELSGARALSVLRYFVGTAKLNAAEFQYAGYADTRPAGDNSTQQGRQKNRRVEITVLRQLQK
ncbi:flagellar motor protein MotB [Paenibacillus sp. YPG26]|uniref:flagellar motor protein MotB n=1 Tax=Paenibacillus sp. YPG26 TaxID=2878915 RepID=UPI00203D8CBB|nr:flagellar motor protein MotB [Paenibacillus sp. YPG26]USB32803.1 OmpA family protein [Paenibacillus sp. YPG26]